MAFDDCSLVRGLDMSTEGDDARGKNAASDRARYTIIIELAGDRWFASWRCMICTELTGNTLRGDTLDAAVARATGRIDNHHKQFHSGP
jgi:hypothetical protein